MNKKELKRESDRRWRLKNLDIIRVKKRLYYLKVKDTEVYKEKKRAYNKLYNKTPKRIEYNRLLKRKNYKRDKERQARYWANNPDSFQRREIWYKKDN